MSAAEGSPDGEERFRWIDETRLQIGGETFVVAPFQDRDPDHFLVIKTPALVKKYLDLVEQEQPRRIIELGFKDGGSAALLSLAATPESLLTIDLASEPPPRLTSFVESAGLQDRLFVRSGVDQGDRAALTSCVDEVFGDRQLDLVVDDASHVLGPTRVSFEVLFPRLRPGGRYIIEDWTSEYLTAQELAKFLPSDTPEFRERLRLLRDLMHALNSPVATIPEAVKSSLTESAALVRAPSGQPASGEGASGNSAFLRLIVQVAATADLSALDGAVAQAPRPLVDLAVELSMLRAGGGDAVSSVMLDGDWIMVERGPGDLDRDHFRLESAWCDHFDYLS